MEVGCKSDGSRVEVGWKSVGSRMEVGWKPESAQSPQEVRSKSAQCPPSVRPESAQSPRGGPARIGVYIGRSPSPPLQWSFPPPRGGGAGTWGRGRPHLRPIYIICASGEESAPTRPHEVYWRKPGGEKADGMTKLETIRQTMRVPDPQMTPQNRHRGGSLRRQMPQSLPMLRHARAHAHARAWVILKHPEAS